MTHNTIYSDNSEHARSKTIRKFITNMRYERNTSAASLSAMLEQDLLPALRSQESGAVPTWQPLRASTQSSAQLPESHRASIRRSTAASRDKPANGLLDARELRLAPARSSTRLAIS